MFAVFGDTTIESRVGAFALTVKLALPVTPPKIALMVTLPAATPIASPVALTLAILLSDEVQLTPLVIIWLLPSE